MKALDVIFIVIKKHMEKSSIIEPESNLTQAEVSTTDENKIKK